MDRRSVDTPGIPPKDDGGAIRDGWNNRVRPAFMEPMPPRGGRTAAVVEGGSALRMIRRRSSSFPLKDDAKYIGYLTDDDESGGGGGGGSGGSGDEGESCGMMMSVVDRRRRELVGSDISFSGCMFMMITVGGLLMLFLFAVSPWGVPPPRRL